MIRLYLMAGAVTLAVGLFWWIRHDAAQDALREAERAAQDARIGHIEDAREVSDDIDRQDDVDRRIELCERLSDGPC